MNSSIDYLISLSKTEIVAILAGNNGCTPFVEVTVRGIKRVFVTSWYKFTTAHSEVKFLIASRVFVFQMQMMFHPPDIGGRSWTGLSLVPGLPVSRARHPAHAHPRPVARVAAIGNKQFSSRTVVGLWHLPREGRVVKVVS